MKLKQRSVVNVCGWALPCGCALLLGQVISASARAEAPGIVQVEEHWELRVRQPDPDRSAPQATIVMSPSEDLRGLFFLFVVNHSTSPTYRAGGMQVQLWEGDNLADDVAADINEPLWNHNEVVRWVQRLSVEDGSMTFQVHSGTSASWGEFGGDELTLTTPTAAIDLNGYRPAVSLAESEVGYAGNRFASLVLTKIALVTGDGQIHEHTAPIPVDTRLDP